jgi:cob(I)alamin adenosyltransferase
MLYTRKGDSGTTKTFGCDQRISKSSNIAEALGSLDEANSLIGLCRAHAKDQNLEIVGKKFEDILFWAQEGFFIVQAELAGAEKSINEERVKETEFIIDSAEKELPPIKTFFIPGEVKLGAFLDVARTATRRAERRVVHVNEEGLRKINPNTLAFLNRMSSLLYALSRLTSHKSGIKESAPSYK